MKLVSYKAISYALVNCILTNPFRRINTVLKAHTGGSIINVNLKFISLLMGFSLAGVIGTEYYLPHHLIGEGKNNFV